MDEDGDRDGRVATRYEGSSQKSLVLGRSNLSMDCNMNALYFV